MATRRVWIVAVVLFGLALLVEANGNFAQTERKSNLELLGDKLQRFFYYQRDFRDFAKSSRSHSEPGSGAEYYEVANELSRIAGETFDHVGATAMLLRVYESVRCKDDLARIKPLLELDFKMYSNVIEENIEYANVQISYTQKPGVAAEAIRMRDDLQETKSIWDSIKLQ